MSCFVLINSVHLNLSCVWISFQTVMLDKSDNERMQTVLEAHDFVLVRDCSVSKTHSCTYWLIEQRERTSQTAGRPGPPEDTAEGTVQSDWARGQCADHLHIENAGHCRRGMSSGRGGCMLTIYIKCWRLQKGSPV